jgi:hypothetical protein
MNAANYQKKMVSSAMGAALAAAAAPALLIFGTATAHAQDPMTVTYDGDLLGIGLTVNVTDNNASFVKGPRRCSYTATPEPGQLTAHLLHTYNYDFALQPLSTTSWKVSSTELGIPALATGTKWAVTVSCTGGYDKANLPLGPSSTSFEQKF